MTDSRRYAGAPSAGSDLTYPERGIVYFWDESGSFSAERERGEVRGVGRHRGRSGAGVARLAQAAHTTGTGVAPVRG
jgi:hypothetical protein